MGAVVTLFNLFFCSRICCSPGLSAGYNAGVTFCLKGRKSAKEVGQFDCGRIPGWETTGIKRIFRARKTQRRRQRPEASFVFPSRMAPLRLQTFGSNYNVRSKSREEARVRRRGRRVRVTRGAWLHFCRDIKGCCRMIDLYYWPTPNGHKITMQRDSLELACTTVRSRCAPRSCGAFSSPDEFSRRGTDSPQKVPGGATQASAEARSPMLGVRSRFKSSHAHEVTGSWHVRRNEVHASGHQCYVPTDRFRLTANRKIEARPKSSRDPTPKVRRP
jgi:hypothetical protein